LTETRGGLIFVSETLIGEPMVVEETEEGERLVRYAHGEFGFIIGCAGANCRSRGAPVDLWTTQRAAHRVHRRPSKNSNKRPRKCPKVSAIYPVQSVNDQPSRDRLTRSEFTS
jgi:hypothetical protein